MEAPGSRISVYWWVNMSVFALVAVLLALSVHLIVALPWYGWLSVLVVSALISHLLVERLLSRYTNRAIGRVLLRRDAKRIAKGLSKLLPDFESNRSLLRERLVAEVNACEDPNRVCAYLLRWADRSGWPPWAVQSVPSCYIPLRARKAGHIKAYAGHYLFECLEAMRAATRLRSLCGGKFIEANLTAEGADFAQRVAAPAFDSCASAGYSDRAQLGIALYAIEVIELCLQREKAEQLEPVTETHKAWLRREQFSPVA